MSILYSVKLILTAMLNLKTTLQAACGCGIRRKIFGPRHLITSPDHLVLLWFVNMAESKEGRSPVEFSTAIKQVDLLLEK